MNLKPTTTKIILVLLITIVLGLIFASLTTSSGKAYSISDSLSISFIFWVIILFFLSYIIYSFAEKGEDHINFKPTLIKTVVSLIISFILGLWARTSFPGFDMTAEQMAIAARNKFIFAFVISLFLIYSIWSLFENRKNYQRTALFYIIAFILIIFFTLLIAIILTFSKIT